MISKRFVKFVKMVLPLFFLFFLILEIQRQFTNYPDVHYSIKTGSVADNLSKGTDLSSLLGDFQIFAYFTTLSNILFVLTILGCWTLKIKISRYWITAQAIYMIISCVLFWTTIAPYVPWTQSWYLGFDNVYEHSVTVLASVVLLVTTPRNHKKNIWIAMGVSIIFPILYLAFAIVMWKETGNGVYPFLNFDDFFALGFGSFKSAFACSGVIIAIFAVIIAMTLIATRPHTFIRLLTKKY